jgi:hypothetical protein
MTEMEGRSLFISSCSRRDLARRRPPHPGFYLPVVLVAASLGAVLVAVLVLVAF